MKLGNGVTSFFVRVCVFVFTVSVIADVALGVNPRMVKKTGSSKSSVSTDQSGDFDYYGDPDGFQSSLNSIVEGAGDANTCARDCSLNLNNDNEYKELSACQSACTARYGADTQSQTSTSPCAQLQTLKNTCANQYTSTSSSCDANKDSGMSKVSSTASQLSLAFGQQSASSIQAACSGVGQISAAANAALAGFRLTCSNSIKKCGDSCTAVVNYLKENPMCDPQGSESSAAQDQVTKCSQFDAKINEANQAMTNVAQTLNNASQCAALTASGETPAICKTNPNLPGCTASGIMDCTNPAMASNKVCICTKNPSDPSCAGVQSAIGSGTSFSSSDPSARLANKNATAGEEDIPGLDPIAQGKAGSTDYSSGAVSGKQGGGASLGGGSGGSSGGGGSRGGFAADGDAGRAVNAGFYGGGGGGSGFSGSGGGGYGGGRGYAGSGSSASGQNGAPNLRQFLPGGLNDPRFRGVAGSSGPDGITGPHSNIWQKVNNRYRTMVPTLLP